MKTITTPTGRVIREAFADPSGWEPTKIQLSIAPEAKGRSWCDWLFANVWTPEQREAWIATNGHKYP